MIGFIQRSLEVKISIALITVLGLVIGVSAVIDIRAMRADMVRASQQSMSALAGTVKGEVTAAMRQGYHADVQRIIDEAGASFGAERIVIYNEQGKGLKSTEKEGGDDSSRQLPAPLLRAASAGDLNEIQVQKGRYSLSYYSPIVNQAECVRCHGSVNRLNGILRIDFSLSGIETLIASRRSTILLWSAVMIAVLMAALVILLRLFVHRPVQELRSAMELAGAGNADVPLIAGGSDELSDLKRRFVAMVNRIGALHRSNLEKEKELARSDEILRFRAELQTMFDAMPDGVLLIDGEMRILQSNPRVYDLLPGLEDTGGRIIPDSRNKESCPFHGIAGVLKEGKVMGHQCSITLANGETKHLHSICAPILENNRVAYVVEVIRDITERVRTEHELEEKTAQLLAANRQLSRIAVTDSLTQVYNRRHFDELMFKEIKRYSRRKYSSLSLMMVDIDGFKTLNDRYGHLTGDMVLRDIAKLLKENVRETDTVARYGGEEFVIVMPDTHLDGAAYRAESLRRKIEQKQFPGQDAPLSVTVSIGVAGYFSGTPQDLVQLADRALYDAKRAGKNAVVVHRPEATMKG